MNNIKIIMPDVLYSSRHKVFKSAVIAFFIIIIVLFIPAVQALTIKNAGNKKLLYCVPVESGDSFSIKYLHSVNKSPVEDFFNIGTGGCVILNKSVFYSFGAGVPSDASDGGKFAVYNDHIEVTEINRRIDNFLLFIGVTAEHRFRMKGEDLLLRSMIEPQRNIWIAVDKVSLFDLFMY